MPLDYEYSGPEPVAPLAAGCTTGGRGSGDRQTPEGESAVASAGLRRGLMSHFASI
eukprot:COSAG03_NODE_525_length_7158_cov_16.603768_7_plen_56_part_00